MDTCSGNSYIFNISIACEFLFLYKKDMTEQGSKRKPTAQAVFFSLFCKLFHMHSTIMGMQTKLVLL